MLTLIGLAGSGFAGGMVFAFYVIPIDSVLLAGSVIGLVMMGLTIFSLSKIKGLWSFEVEE